MSPMWMVTVSDDVVTVALDHAHLRQLERVSFRDFIRLGEPVTAVIVRSGLTGFRHNVVVPMSNVAKVQNDEITAPGLLRYNCAEVSKVLPLVQRLWSVARMTTIEGLPANRHLVRHAVHRGVG